MFKALGVFFNLIKRIRGHLSPHIGFFFLHLISWVEFFIHFYILSSSTRVTITKRRYSLLGICDPLHPSQRGGEERKLCFILSTFYQILDYWKLRWSTGYSRLNRCDSSEYYSRKAALGPIRSGLTDELLKNGISLTSQAGLWLLRSLTASLCILYTLPQHSHGGIVTHLI